jgi:hypothetical protein
MDEAKFKGSDYVSVYTKMKPTWLFLSVCRMTWILAGLNDKWTVYNSNRQKGWLRLWNGNQF